MTPAHERSEKLSTKWLEQNVPERIQTLANVTMCSFPILHSSCAVWSLIVDAGDNGVFRGTLRHRVVHPGQGGSTGFLPLGQLSTVGELIDLYERLRGKKWPTPTPKEHTR